MLGFARTAQTPPIYTGLKAFDPAVRGSQAWGHRNAHPELLTALKPLAELRGKSRYRTPEGQWQYGFHDYPSAPLRIVRLQPHVLPTIYGAHEEGELTWQSVALRSGIRIERSLRLPTAARSKRTWENKPYDRLKRADPGYMQTFRFHIAANGRQAVRALHKRLHPQGAEVEAGTKWWTWAPALFVPFQVGGGTFHMQHTVDGQVRVNKPGLQSFEQSIALLKAAMRERFESGDNVHTFTIQRQNDRQHDGAMTLIASPNAQRFEIGWTLPALGTSTPTLETLRHYAATPLVRATQQLHHDIFLRAKPKL